MVSLSQKIEAYFEQHKRTLLIVACVLAGVILVSVGFALFGGKQDNASLKEWELLDESYTAYLDMSEPAEDSNEPSRAQVRTDLIEKYEAFAVSGKDFVALERDFTLGMLYFDDAKYAEAAEQFARVAVAGETGLFYPTAVMNQAASLESAGKIDDVVALYESLLKKDAIVGLSLAEVRVELARLYAQNGRESEARDMYQAVIDAKDAAWADHAKTMLFRLNAQ